MKAPSDDEFAKLVSQCIDALPEKYTKYMNNVAVVYAATPTPAQREALALRPDQSLFGLYEGVPLTQRGASYNLVLPDKITLFKDPLVFVSHSLEDLKQHIMHTLWHELAHHYGLDHERINRLDHTAY